MNVHQAVNDDLQLVFVCFERFQLQMKCVNRAQIMVIQSSLQPKVAGIKRQRIFPERLYQTVLPRAQSVCSLTICSSRCDASSLEGPVIVLVPSHPWKPGLLTRGIIC